MGLRFLLDYVNIPCFHSIFTLLGLEKNVRAHDKSYWIDDGGFSSFSDSSVLIILMVFYVCNCVIHFMYYHI